MKEIIKEILPLVLQFYSCVGREKEKKYNKIHILRVRKKQTKKLLLKKIMDMWEKIIPSTQKDYFFRCNMLNFLRKNLSNFDWNFFKRKQKYNLFFIRFLSDW
jgi:hypothetical protein